MALRALVSLGVLGVLLWSSRSHFPRIAETLAKTNLLIFFVAALIFIFHVIILSYRLDLLFAGEGLKIPLGRVIQLNFIGFLFNNFLPTAVGGDIVKAYYAQKETRETAKSFIAVFMDRFVGLIAFIFIGIVALIFSWKSVDLNLRKLVLIFALAGNAVFVIIMNDRVAKAGFGILSKLKLWNLGEKISKVYRAVHEYKNKTGIILAVIGISIVCQSIYFLVVHLLAVAIGADISVMTVFLIMPIVSVVSMLPSVGGLGLREGAMVALFGPLIGFDKAFSVSILLLLSLLILSLIGGAIYAFAAQFKIRGEDISKLEKYSV